MNQNQSIQAAIAALRRTYEDEIAQIRTRFEALIDERRAAVRAAEEFDYTREYKDAYSAVLTEMERVYARYREIAENTPHVTLSLSAIEERLSPTPIPTGKVEERFAALMRECYRLADWLESAAVEEQLAGAEALCQCLVDLSDIASRADALLYESGLPEEKRRAALFAAQDALEDATEEYECALREESLACYPELSALRDAVKKQASRFNRLLLGNDPADREHGYRFPIAFKRIDFPAEDADFVSEVLGVCPDCLRKEPIFFEPEGAHAGGSIVIKAHKAYFSERESILLQNIYYSMAVTPPKNCFQMAAIECGRKRPWLRSLINNSQKLSPAMVYSVGSQKTSVQVGFASDREESITTKRLMQALFQTLQDRQVEMHDGIYEYNRSSDHMPMPCLGVFIHGYPSGFESYREAEVSDEHTLHILQREGGESGIYTVILHNVDAPMPEAIHAPMPLEERALVIDYTDPDHPTIDGQEIDIDIRTPDFDEEEYLQKIHDFYLSQDTYYLDEILEQSPEAQRAPRHVLESFDIRFPIGIWDNQPAYIEYNAGSEENTLIIGGSDSGKSSMLHTFILSCASCYSPEEVIFYLADFKAEGESPEFSHYVREEKRDNLYIPHVKYFQKQCDATGALDMLGMIERVYKERNRQMRLHGKENFKGYNQLPEVKSGKLPAMPMLFFIIDEAQVMMGHSRYAHSLSEVLQNRILNQIRNAGMAVIMVAQEMNIPAGYLYGSGTNVKRRMVIGYKTDRGTISDLFHKNDEHTIQSERVNSDATFLSPEVKGRMIFGTKSGCRHVLVGFAGGTSSERAKAIASRIREKYATMPDGTPRTYNQILGGSEALVPITEDMASYADVHTAPDERSKDFSLCIGLTSTGGLPSMAEFSRDPAMGPGYFAIMGEEKLAKVGRNIMFAFLYRSAGQYHYNKPRITYCANVPDTAATIGAYTQAFPYLSEHITVVSEFADRSRVLLRAKKLYEKRERIHNTTVDAEFEPYLIVLHNIEWIGSEKCLPSDEEIVEAPRSAESEEALRALEAEREEAKQRIAALGGADLLGHLNIADMAALANYAQEASSAADHDEDEDAVAVFSVAEVTEAFRLLYEKGNHYGIYLLVLSATDRELRNAIGRQQQLPMQHGIFDSFKHMEGEPAASKTETAYVCHLCTGNAPEGRKTRLYDYTPRTQGAFFTALEERLGGEKEQ